MGRVSVAALVLTLGGCSTVPLTQTSNAEIPGQQLAAQQAAMTTQMLLVNAILTTPPPPPPPPPMP